MDLLFPYTEEELANKKCSTPPSPLLCLQASSMLKKPVIFDSIYVPGFSMLCLTPACAARLTATVGLYFLNASLTKSCSAILPLMNVNLLPRPAADCTSPSLCSFKATS